MTKPSFVIASLLASVALGACSEQAPPPERPPPPVSVMTVEPRTIPAIVEFVAQTESSRQVDIVARVSGYLDRIAYQEGQVVEAGQVLFELDERPFRAQLEAARGELLAQQARLTTATASLKRVKPLARQNALSQADLDRAQGEFDAASAAVHAADAKVTEAMLNLGYTSIHSPLTGLASRSLQREGAYINAMSTSARLTYVAALDPIWVNFSVSQNQMAKRLAEIESGQLVPPENQEYEVELVLPDGSVFPERGRISFADPSFSQDTGSFFVRAELPNSDQMLRPGMFVTALVKGSVRPDAIVVPQLAVQQGANGHLVYVVKKDGTAEVRPVVVGDYFNEKDIVIVSGLQGGDRVVIDGMLKVVPGKPVEIVEPGKAPPESASEAKAGEAAAGAAATKQ